MATAKQVSDWKKAKERSEKMHKAHKVLNILTGVFGVVWPVGMSAGILYQTFTWLLQYCKDHNPPFTTVYTLLLCAAVVVGCIVAIIFGIFTSIKAYHRIDWNDSIAFGVCCIIFGMILPGVLFLVTRYLQSASSFSDDDPREVEKEERAARRAEEKRRKDPRRKFTIDDDDVGVVPDINRVDHKELDEVLDDDEKEVSLD